MNIEIQTGTDTSQLQHASPHITSSRPSRKNTTHSFCDDPYNPVRGEKALWVAVIMQAMTDALSRSLNKEVQYHKHEAIRWLTENSKDFIEVCLSADMNPDEVRRKAKRALLNPSSWRAAPGEGKRYVERKIYRQKIKERKLKTQLRKDGSLLPPVRIELPLPIGGHIIVGPWA